MMEIYYILESLESDNSRLEKEFILRKHSTNLILKKIFESSYDPYVNYYVSKFKKPIAIEINESKLEDFFILLEKLSMRSITGNSAKNEVIKLFAQMNKLEQKWCERILLKNLRCGVSDTTINKIWPNTIKSFSVSLAETLDAKTTDGEFEIIQGQISYPVFVEPKLDGLRLIAIKENGKVTLYTRNGSLINTLPSITKILEDAENYDDIVLDGEIMGESWNESASVVMSHKHNKDDSNMIYNVFDIVFLENWRKQEFDLSFEDRRFNLESVVNNLIKSDKIKLVPSTLINNENELRNFYIKYLNENFEGVMLKDSNAKYVWKRSKAIMKLKPVSTHEGIIVDWIEGKRGTKREGMFGGFTVLFPNGVTTNVASGFNDKLKAEIQLEGPDSYVGTIVECEAQPPFTDEGRLRFPVFVRIRNQKDVDPKIIEAYNNYRRKLT